jgi:hypothetical protein
VRQEEGGGGVDFLETLFLESKAPREGFWKDWSRFQSSN